MKMEEILHRLESDPNVPAGGYFITNLKGHLVSIEVIRNRTEMLKPQAEEDIPKPVIVGIEEGVSQEKPQQIDKEPLDAGRENEPSHEPGPNPSNDMPEMRIMEGSE